VASHTRTRRKTKCNSEVVLKDGGGSVEESNNEEAAEATDAVATEICFVLIGRSHCELGHFTVHSQPLS